MSENRSNSRPIGQGMGRGPGHHASFEKAKDSKRAFKGLLSYIGQRKIIILIASFFLMGSVILKALTPAMIGDAIDLYIIKNPSLDQFTLQMSLVIVLLLISWGVEAIGGFLIIRLSNQIIFKLRENSFAHIQGLSMGYFNRTGIGDLISRMTNDMEMIYNAMSNGISSIVNGIFTMISILIAMFIRSWSLTLIVLAILPVLLFLTSLIGKLVKDAFQKNQKAVGALSGHIQESITGIKVIQSFNKEEKTIDDFNQKNNDVRRIGIRSQFLSHAFMPIMFLATALSLALLITFGGVLAIYFPAVFSIGLITSFIIYAQRFFEPIRQMTNIYNIFQSALAGAERVFEVLETKAEIKSSLESKNIKNFRGDVEFKDVHFWYEENKPVLENVGFFIEAGKNIAIVGPTGAGKTTIINLLTRFYDIQKGEISIDGVNIKDMDLDYLRNQMGIVLQEPFFFATTIMENLKYGRPAASDEEVFEAAKLAEAHNFIRRLPEGYNTQLSERGMNLSQGERQLLAIARVILKDPKILILDEATSSIDSLTEVHIQKALLSLMKNRTSFIIAHRLSTIKNAHKVVVVHDKHIIEEGTHQSLMNAKGFYYRLYSLQFQKSEITEDMSI
ncbi:MAG: ABC transporter ATP-binding protein [Spirochaetales bacterium]|nr:ABC transporter ATP-binding protein [Spirochaetales bacterium]